MSDHHPTAPAATVKPAKPCPEIPLFPHATQPGRKRSAPSRTASARGTTPTEQ
jgi:hypothetical protein